MLLTSCSTPLPKRQLNKEAVDELVQTGQLKSIVDELVKPLIDNQIVIGAAVGVIAPGFGEQIYTYGRKSVTAPDPVDADTIFQIGSMTKVFTTAILAKWVTEKRMKLTDDVRQHYNYFIPLRKPESTGRITFLQIASHSSDCPKKSIILRITGVRYKLDSDWEVCCYSKFFITKKSTSQAGYFDVRQT